MRVAIVGNFGLDGDRTSMAFRALPIARELARRGHQVRMALPVRRPGDIAGSTVADEIEVYQFSAKLPFGPQCHILQIIRMLIWCLDWHPTVVYCFKPVAHSGAILQILSLFRRLGIYRGRIVLDTDDWEGDGGWNEKHRVPGWVKRLIAWQERWSLRHADVVAAASVELARLVLDAGASSVVYVPNCLPDNSPALSPGDGRAARGGLKIQDGPVVLIYTRFVEYSLDRLVRTLEGLAQLRPDVTFVVAGSGLRHEEEELRKHISDIGLGGRFRIIGWVAQDQLPDLLACADLALYLIDDNLLNRTKCPVKLVELTSAGVPVVADRVGQASEYLVDGVTGLLVPAGDAEAMVSAAVSLLNAPNRRLEMGSKAKDAAARWRWGDWSPLVEKALVGEFTGPGQARPPSPSGKV